MMRSCESSHFSARIASYLLFILQFKTTSAFMRSFRAGGLVASSRIMAFSSKQFFRRCIISRQFVTSDDTSPCAFLPTILTRTAKEIRKPRPISKENAGIRLLKETEHFVALWKTSNVALYPGERLTRPASIPVADWLSSYLSNSNFTLMFQNLLSSDTSGILIVAASEVGNDFLSKSSESDSMSLTYETIIHDREAPSKRGNTLTASDRLKALTKSMSQAANSGNGAAGTPSVMKFSLTRSENSGTHGTLNLVTITYTGPRIPSYLTPKLIEQSLESVGFQCFREGTKPFLSMVEIEVIRDSMLRVRESTPSKFLKLLRRENILYERLKAKEVTVTGRDSVVDDMDGAQVLQKMQFMGLDIQVSDSALTPRASSSLVVRQAILEMQQKRAISGAAGRRDAQEGRSRTGCVRVLDLGCGSGALLLATLTGLQSVSMSAIGVGVDLDERALGTAEINAARNGQPACAWVRADFGQLHTQTVRHLLTNAIQGCESSQADVSNVGPRGGLFDVILCNPPYLSSRAAAGRVTGEGRDVLVGGLTGMEPYIAICNSVFAACHNVTDMNVNGSTESDVSIAVGVGEEESISIAASAAVSQLSSSTKEGKGRLLGKRLLSKEKVSSSVEAVTAVLQGILSLHDVQHSSSFSL